MMWPFKWKLSACTVTWCYVFFKILQNEIGKLGRNFRLATFGFERVKFLTLRSRCVWCQNQQNQVVFGVPPALRPWSLRPSAVINFIRSHLLLGLLWTRPDYGLPVGFDRNGFISASTAVTSVWWSREHVAFYSAGSLVLPQTLRPVAGWLYQ